MSTPASPTPAVPTAADIAAIVQQVLAGLKTNTGVNISATTDIGAVALAVSKLCDVAMTTQGQAVIEDWRKGAATFNTAIASAWNGFLGLFK